MTHPFAAPAFEAEHYSQRTFLWFRSRIDQLYADTKLLFIRRTNPLPGIEGPCLLIELDAGDRFLHAWLVRGTWDSLDSLLAEFREGFAADVAYPLEGEVRLERNAEGFPVSVDVRLRSVQPLPVDRAFLEARRAQIVRWDPQLGRNADEYEAIMTSLASDRRREFSVEGIFSRD